MPKTVKNRKRVLSAKRVAFGLFVLLVAGLIAAIKILGGEFSVVGAETALARVLGRAKTEFTLTDGYGEVFYDFGASFVSAGGTGISVVNVRGEETDAASFALDEPSVASNGRLAVVYSVGGYNAAFADSRGIRYVLRTDGIVLSAAVGRGGTAAVVTGESGGYKGAVRLYKLRGDTPELTFEWFSGTDYVYLAAVSDDGKRFCAVSLGESGSRITAFQTTSRTPQFEARYPEAVLGASYMRGDLIFLRTRSKLLSLSENGELSELYDFGSSVLSGYTASDSGFAAFTTETAAGVTVTTIDERGETHAAEVPGAYVSVRCADGRIAVLTDAAAYIFSDDSLKSVREITVSPGFTDIFPRGRGSAIVFGGFGAEIIG